MPKSPGDGPIPLSEADVLGSCKYYLRTLSYQGKLQWRRIHVTAIPRSFGKMQFKYFSKNHDMAGMPDFEIYLPDGKILHIECKSLSGRLNSAQIAWREKLEALGHPYFVVRCLDDLIEILAQFSINHWAYPTKGVHDGKEDKVSKSEEYKICEEK